MKDETSIAMKLSHCEDIAESFAAFFMSDDLRIVTSMYLHILESAVSDEECEKFLKSFLSSVMVKSCVNSSNWADAENTINQLCAYTNMIEQAMHDEDLTESIQSEIEAEIDHEEMIRLKSLLILGDFLEFAESRLSISLKREFNELFDAKLFDTNAELGNEEGEAA